MCGIADGRMQRALLAEPELTFVKALQIIQTMEAAARDSRDWQAQSTEPTSVNAITPSQNPVNKPCFRCGELHSPEACWFKDFLFPLARLL